MSYYYGFEQRFNPDDLLSIAEDVEARRTCLYTGAQIYGAFFSGRMFGDYVFDREGLPNLASESEALEKEFNDCIDVLEADLKGFAGWLDMIKIDEKLANEIKEWFFGHFPAIAMDADARIRSGVFLEKMGDKARKARGNEKEILMQVHKFLSDVYAVAPAVMYIKYNFRDKTELIYVGDRPDIILPRTGAVVNESGRMLYSVLPKTERALKLLDYIARGNDFRIFSLVPFEACMDDDEGGGIEYVGE